MDDRGLRSIGGERAVDMKAEILAIDTLDDFGVRHHVVDRCQPAEQGVAQLLEARLGSRAVLEQRLQGRRRVDTRGLGRNIEAQSRHGREHPWVGARIISQLHVG